ARTRVGLSADALLASDDRWAEIERTVLDHGVVHLARRLCPVGEDLLGGNSGRALERRFRTERSGGQEKTHDGVIAETSADVGQQRLTVAVREVVRIAGELAKIGH